MSDTVTEVRARMPAVLRKLGGPQTSRISVFRNKHLKKGLKEENQEGVSGSTNHGIVLKPASLIPALGL